MKKLTLLFCLSSLFLIPGVAQAHSGGTDAGGGHHCRTNCSSYGYSYGEYHYHNGGTSYSYPSYSYPGYTSPTTSYSYTNYESFVVVANMGYDGVILTDGYSEYLIDYTYGCSSWNMDAGDTIYIDTYYSPSWGDDILLYIDYGSTETCSVTTSEKLDLTAFAIVSDLGNSYIIIDGNGDYSVIETSFGCYSMSEGDIIYINNATYLGWGDDIYDIDSEDSCYVTDADSDYSSYYSTPSYTTTYTCEAYGEYAYAIGEYCYCDTGYEWNSAQDECVASTLSCVDNASDIGGICLCDDGYIASDESCITIDARCAELYGPNTLAIEEDESVSCICNSGYEWDDHGTSCIEPSEEETVLIEHAKSKEDLPEDTSAGSAPASLLGRILLQVESHGEAWYIQPSSGERYYMKDGDTAYQMMRNFSLGISNSNLDTIDAVDDADEMLGATSDCSSNSLANSLKGQILLQVEEHGEAWYVHPDACKRIYLKDGDAAYEVMRYLSLGITDADLIKIEMGEMSYE